LSERARVVAQDSAENLRRPDQNSINVEVILEEDDPKVVNALEALPWVNSLTVRANHILINIKKNEELRPLLLAKIMEINSGILSFHLQEATLEDILMRVLHQSQP